MPWLETRPTEYRVCRLLRGDALPDRARRMTELQQSTDVRLAADGGTPIRKEPFPPWPHFAADEVEAAANVLRSGKANYWTGEECRQFEAEFAAHCEVDHAVAVANGSVALELVLSALDIGRGDEVIVPARTFIASASSVILVGARPVFADVDPVSQNITVDTIRPLCSPKTKAIIAVHLAGWPCEMEPIRKLAEELGLKVIEDCAQAHGATYNGHPVGSFGDAAAFSFCNDKIMSTGGEGGMVVTNDAKLWERMWAYKDHGKNYDTVYHKKHGPGFRWLHESFGTNWRLTEFQAAIGRAQLRKLADQVDTRLGHAAHLTSRLRELPALRLTEPPSHVRHSYYKYYMFLRSERLRSGWDRDRVLTAINAEGVPCFVGSCSEVYLEKAFDTDDLRPRKRLPVASELGESSLMFQVHPTLGTSEIDDLCRAAAKVLHVASC